VFTILTIEYSSMLNIREMPPTTVVRLRRKNGAIVSDCDVYIGRAAYQGGWNLPASKWANPYRIDGSTPAARQKCLTQYAAYIRSSPELMAALPELRGKVLGCWCGSGLDPAAHGTPNCHGDVLVLLSNEASAATRPRKTAPSPPRVTLPDLSDPIWDEIGRQ
jgi:hypothetical protein